MVFLIPVPMLESDYQRILKFFEITHDALVDAGGSSDVMKEVV